MSLPGASISDPADPSELVAPDDIDRIDFLVDYEMGGIGVNDSSAGLLVRQWKAWSDGVDIWCAPVDDLESSTLITSGTQITEVSLAFNQNMDPVVAYVDEGEVKLYWYDTALESMTTTTYAGASTPMVSMDDKRDGARDRNDILFCYLRGGSLYYRQQRDRYNTEYWLASNMSTGARIMAVGMGKNLRFHIRIIDFYNTVHCDLLTDTMYVTDGISVIPMFAGAASTATWRSGILVLNKYPAFGWVRVEGDYPALLRIYGDGDLIYTTPSITSNAPLRLPPGRHREWQVEVESAGRVTSVELATTAAELSAA